jgi:hypothetical protein
MEKLSYENILTNVTLHQIDSTSLHLLFQRNFTLKNVINYQDFLYGISLPDIHLDLVFINDVLICQTLCLSELIQKCYILFPGVETNFPPQFILFFEFV